MDDKLRLLIVDDSMVMRKMIQQLVETVPAFQVVGTAVNGQEAVTKARQLRPDVITMDVRMPVMDGLEALKAIMAERPTPVIMVSAVTTEGADETLEALAAGAVDFLPKGVEGKSLPIEKLKTLLLAKIRMAAISRLPGSAAPRPIQTRKMTRLPPPAVPAGKPIELVVIGSSTGGPNALQVILPQLPGDLSAGLLIVQHMPATFTRQLAQRLDRSSALRVKEAEEGDEVLPGTALLAPGHSHLVLRQRNRVGLEQEPADLLHRPSIDVAIDSAACLYGEAALGVILTGMGQDGRRGMESLKAKGGRGIAQDESTSVIYGMPRAVAEAGLADQIVPLEEISATILAYLR
jgi:two-component system, chemotaxis family, protein-glutamate methylesterase/glutaminase